MHLLNNYENYISLALACIEKRLIDLQATEEHFLLSLYRHKLQALKTISSDMLTLGVHLNQNNLITVILAQIRSLVDSLDEKSFLSAYLNHISIDSIITAIDVEILKIKNTIEVVFMSNFAANLSRPDLEYIKTIFEAMKNMDAQFNSLAKTLALFIYSSDDEIDAHIQKALLIKENIKNLQEHITTLLSDASPTINKHLHFAMLCNYISFNHASTQNLLEQYSLILENNDTTQHVAQTEARAPGAIGFFGDAVIDSPVSIPAHERQSPSPPL